MTLKILTGNESYLIESKCTQAISFYHKVDLEMLHKSVTISGPDIVIVFPGALASEEYQFELGQTLCQVPYDLTIFTHSSCLIAGVRYGVLNNYIKPKDIELLFYNPKGECIKLHISEYGVIENWPKGFMDTMDRASLFLLKGSLAKKNKT